MGKIVLIDLFYYDNIFYVDFLDFFYVWLCFLFKFVYFELFVMFVVFKVEELVVFVYRYDGKLGVEDFFLNGMINVMQCIVDQFYIVFFVIIY